MEPEYGEAACPTGHRHRERDASMVEGVGRRPHGGGPDPRPDGIDWRPRVSNATEHGPPWRHGARHQLRGTELGWPPGPSRYLPASTGRP